VAVAPPAFGASLMQRAQQGDAQSQFAVGLEYLHGDGVPRDTVLAYKWLKLASLGGVSAASSIARDTYAHLDESGRVQGSALVAAARNDPRPR
jgi:TPR repeat protein